MSALQKDLQELLAKHIALAPHKLPRLIEVLSDCELVAGLPMVHGISGLTVGYIGDRFVNVGSDGRRTTRDHVAIYDQETDLTWAAAPLPKGEHAEITAAAAVLSLVGLTTWKVATVKQLIGGPVDYAFYNPVLDKKHFAGWPSEYVWTSTPDPDPDDAASCSCVVNLGRGNVDRHRHDYRYHALAVCAGQPLGLQF